MGKGWQVKCSQGYCKFKGSYSSLVGAKEAIADHKAETQKRSLGAHQAVIVQETPRGTRSPPGGRRRLRRTTVALFSEYAEAGGLLSYGPNLREAQRGPRPRQHQHDYDLLAPHHQPPAPGSGAAAGQAQRGQ